MRTSGDSIPRDYFVGEEHAMSTAETAVWSLLNQVIHGADPDEGYAVYKDLVSKYGTGKANTNKGKRPRRRKQ